MLRPAARRYLTRPSCIAAVSFGLHLALLFVVSKFFAAPYVPGAPYGFELGRVAKSLAEGRGFASPLATVDTGPTAWFAPVYPSLIASIFRLLGIYSRASLAAIHLLNCALVALTVLPIYAIARRTFNEPAAVAAAWVWTLLPTALYFPIGWLWDDCLTALLFAAIFAATLWLADARHTSALRFWTWAGYGLLWAVAALTNPSVFSVFPFFLAWLVWKARRGSRWEPLRNAALAVLIFVAAVLPWTIRNYRVLGAIVPFRSNFGLELWLGNNPKVVSLWTPLLHPNEDAAEGRLYQQLGEIPYMRQKESAALRFIRAHPGVWASATAGRMAYLWTGVADFADLGRDAYSTAKLAVNFPLGLLAAAGLITLYRRARQTALLYIIVVLVFPFVYYITHPLLRYRFPMDPLLAVLASYAGWAAAGRMSGRIRSRTGADEGIGHTAGKTGFHEEVSRL